MPVDATDLEDALHRRPVRAAMGRSVLPMMPDQLSLVTTSEPTPIMLRYSESGGIVDR
jgi:hypothetical protein